MMAMARAGGGNAYYGKSAEDMIDPFREELDLLNGLSAWELELSLETPPGVAVSVLNDYDRLSNGRWRLPDLAYGGEAWALVELRIPSRLAPTTGTGDIEIMRALLAFGDEDTSNRTAGPECLRLPWLPAAAFSALAEDEVVRRRAQEIRAAEIQERARRAARRRDWQGVEKLLLTVRREAKDNPWLQHSIDALSRYARHRQTENFSKEALYKAQKMRRRLVDPGESFELFDLNAEESKATYLRRKLEQGKRSDKHSGSKGGR